MAITGANRGLATLAVLRLSERDLRSFHEFISKMSGTLFVETVRDLEDKFDNSISVTLEQNDERSFVSLKFSDLYRDLDRLRQVELGITVAEFVDELTKNIVKSVQATDRLDVPNFDSRRGFQAWIKKLVKQFPEAVVFHAAMRMKYDRSHCTNSDWKL